MFNSHHWYHRPWSIHTSIAYSAWSAARPSRTETCHQGRNRCQVQRETSRMTTASKRQRITLFLQAYKISRIFRGVFSGSEKSRENQPSYHRGAGRGGILGEVRASSGPNVQKAMPYKIGTLMFFKHITWLLKYLRLEKVCLDRSRIQFVPPYYFHRLLGD